jgi:hypothetical protein
MALTASETSMRARASCYRNGPLSPQLASVTERDLTRVESDVSVEDDG